MHPIFFTKFSTTTFSVKLLELVGNFFWNYRSLRSFWCILKVCGTSHGHRLARQKNHFHRFFSDFSGTHGLMAIKLVSIDASRQYASIGMHYNLYPIKIEVTSSEKRNFNFSTKNRRAFRTFAAKMEFFWRAILWLCDVPQTSKIHQNDRRDL